LIAAHLLGAILRRIDHRRVFDQLVPGRKRVDEVAAVDLQPIAAVRTLEVKTPQLVDGRADRLAQRLAELGRRLRQRVRARLDQRLLAQPFIELGAPEHAHAEPLAAQAAQLHRVAELVDARPPEELAAGGEVALAGEAGVDQPLARADEVAQVAVHRHVDAETFEADLVVLVGHFHALNEGPLHGEGVRGGSGVMLSHGRRGGLTLRKNPLRIRPCPHAT
jgi:hypothetical protein